MSTDNIEIYENPETGEYEVDGVGRCAGLFDIEIFEGDNAQVDAYAFAQEWQYEASKIDVDSEVVWTNTTAPAWVDRVA